MDTIAINTHKDLLQYSSTPPVANNTEQTGSNKQTTHTHSGRQSTSLHVINDRANREIS